MVNVFPRVILDIMPVVLTVYNVIVHVQLAQVDFQVTANLVPQVHYNLALALL